MIGEAEMEIRGAPEIAAHVQQWFRRARHRRVTVTAYHVRRWVVEMSLPASRIGKGQLRAAPSEVLAWCERVLAPTMDFTL